MRNFGTGIYERFHSASSRPNGHPESISRFGRSGIGARPLSADTVSNMIQKICIIFVMRSGRLIHEILSRSEMTQTELADRLGVSRVTVTRWASGVTEPSFEALEAAALVTGKLRLSVTVEPLTADPALIDAADAQLNRGPTNRLKALLGDSWPKCRDALRAVASFGELSVLAGPVAAALAGAPLLSSPRVDILVAEDDLDRVRSHLTAFGARRGSVEQAPSDERALREHWHYGRGALTIRDRAAGLDQAGIRQLREWAFDSILNADDVGIVREPAIEDLVRILSASPWPEDQAALEALDAALITGRYRSRLMHPGVRELVLV
jgi:transcriptional regulator with XRE-family HTH domain